MSDRLGIYSERELKAARALVRELIRVVRSVRLYEGDHPNLAEMQVQLRKRWDTATAGGPVALRLTDRKVLLQEDEVLTADGGNEVIPTALYEHGVVGLIFKRGIEPGELRRLLRVLAEEPDATADYATALWEADLKHLQVLLDADDDWDEVPSTAGEFAEQMARMGDENDPPPANEYDEQHKQLVEAVAARGTGPPPELATASGLLDQTEQVLLDRLLAADTFPATVRHVFRVVFNMAREALAVDEAEVLDQAIATLAPALATSGDLTGATEVLRQARELAGGGSPTAARAGEETLAAFLDPQVLWAFLRELDQHEKLTPRDLGGFLVELGDSAAATVAEWLVETRHPQAVAQAMRVYGEGLVRVLVPLYKQSGREARERIGPALLELESESALVALAVDFAQHPDATRMRILKLIGRNQDPALRHVVVAALDDPSERVRAKARAAARREDAPAIAATLQSRFQPGGFESRPRKEVEEIFEMLSRIGDARVAIILAEQCAPKGLRLRRMRLDTLQQLCVRALRRMRDPGARKVVVDLKAHGPKAVRDALDDPFVDFR